jgi:hypothetical protein
MKLRPIILGLVLATVLAPCLGRAVDAPWAADSRLVASLQAKAGVAKPLPAEGSGKEEMLLALAALSDQVQASGGEEPAGWKQEDYDALFALLQRYREDLKAARARMAALEAAGDSLAAQEADLERRLSLLPPDGFKMNGEVRFTADSVWLHRSDPTPGDPTILNHALPGLTLFFVGNKGPFSANARYDIDTVVGDVSHLEGLHFISIEMRTPLVAQLGNFYGRMTPLTLWRNEDPEPFEAEPYRSRRQRLRELALIDDTNSWKIPRAARFLTDMVLYDKQVLHLELWWTVQATQGTSLYLIEPLGPSLNATGDINEAAWKVGVPLTPGFSLQYSGTKYWQRYLSGGTYAATFTDPQSGNPDPCNCWPAYLEDQPLLPFDSQVHSFSASWEGLNGTLKAQGEYALSMYRNPNDLLVYQWPATLTMYSADNPVPDNTRLGSATTLGLDWDLNFLRLKASGNLVDANFVSPMAQGRTYDPSQFRTQLLVENSVYNAGTNLYGGFPFDTYNETYFNDQFLPPLLSTPGTELTNPKAISISPAPPELLSSHYLLPYPLTYAGSPYGLATPNRLGLDGSLALPLWSGALELLFPMEWQSNVSDNKDPGGNFISPKGTFVAYGGGFHLDLKPPLGIPVKLVAGLRATSFSDLPVVAAAVRQRTTATDSLDAGVEWAPWTGGNLFTGMKRQEIHNDFYLPSYSAAQGLPLDTKYHNAGGSDELDNGFGAGFSQLLNDWARWDFNASVTYFPSALDPSRQEELRQVWGKFSILF